MYITNPNALYLIRHPRRIGSETYPPLQTSAAGNNRNYFTSAAAVAGAVTAVVSIGQQSVRTSVYALAEKTKSGKRSTNYRVRQGAYIYVYTRIMCTGGKKTSGFIHVSNR